VTGANAQLRSGSDKFPEPPLQREGCEEGKEEITNKKFF
jgi:hypothetical protein